jgi:tRNA(Ile)-lysidine synthase
MTIDSLEPGKYIVAVSGGVDSVVLLDALSRQGSLDLTIAHFDHGIRGNSADDRKFVESLAKKYNLVFEYAEGKLGPNASEATAREARYDFLDSVRHKHQATAIVTAHHQDDLVETIILNLLRGTGRKGITSLKNTDTIKRPLLHCTKKEILQYAHTHAIEWHEDETNDSTEYLRNWIRHSIIPRLTKSDRQKFLDIHADLSERNKEIDSLLANFTGEQITILSKQDIIMADHALAKELVANWLRANKVPNFDQKVIERIVIGAKTLQTGKIIPVVGTKVIEVQDKLLVLKP